MQWFYASAGKQSGPINEGNFGQLVREGVIQPTTLVWHDGMADWQPYANVATNVSPPATPGQLTCRECGQLVAEEDTLRIDGATICAACKPTYLQKMREGAVSPPPADAPAFHYAGFWIRVPAAVIDGVLLIAVSTGIAMATGSTFLQSVGFEDSAWDARQWLLLATETVIDTAYSAVLVTKFGGTLGKLICGIRVVTADGRRLTYAHSVGRALAQYVSLLPCGIGFLFAAFDSQKRALHDMICNTRVIWAKQL